MTTAFLARARPFLDSGVLAPADVHAVALTAPRFGETDSTRLLGLAFAVRAPRMGHAGVMLGNVARQIDADQPRAEPTEPIVWPDPSIWHDLTLGSSMVGDAADRHAPFVRQPTAGGSLLITRRMYREQERVAEALRRRAAQVVADRAQISDLDARIAGLFPDDPAGEAARAVRLAATHRLALVIGGPGTGKTFSITRLLVALITGRTGEKPLVVELAAPTGKAAVRVREAILEATSDPRLEIDAAVRGQLQALQARTLHRLIGMRPDGSSRHHRDNPIPADVIVVDEVSMVDLHLMRCLVEAVHDEARLVLLGDRDQLASVEAGCVLADLVADGSTGPLASSIQVFTRSRRFADAPDVALVAACLQSYATRMEGVPADPSARIDRAVEVFAGRDHASLEPHPGRRICALGPPDQPADDRPARPAPGQIDALVRSYTEGFDLLHPDGSTEPREGYARILKNHLLPTGKYATTAQDPATQRQILDALDRYRVLAVHRRGPLGVSGLNQALARALRSYLGCHGDGGRHWIGLPILVTENSYEVGLMNGDVGLILPTAAGRAAVFPGEDPGSVRAVAISRLPPHDSALAMTVHKAQGSQFDRVALVLAGRFSPIQTRELIYTGVTRAKNQLAWLGKEDELREALGRQVERASGLSALLGEG